MMMGCSGGFSDPNLNNNRDRFSIKATNLHHHHHAVLLTPKLSSTSNMFRNPVLPLNNHHHHQMFPVATTLSQQGRSSSGFLYSDKQPAAAAPGRRCRWNPTTEQIMALKDMYQSGIKIPTAQQIRQVTARLRNYGRIEGKNVYYWFQNHRARERQKRRQEFMSMDQSDSKLQQQTFTKNTISDLTDKESAGVACVRLEDERPNKRTLTNCTGNFDQETSSLLQERMMSMVKRNSSRELVEQSDSPENTSAALTCTKLLDYHHYYDYHYGMVLTAPNVDKETEEECRETQTLELFPLKSDNLQGAKDTKLAISRTTSTDSTTADFLEDQYFLFL